MTRRSARSLIELAKKYPRIAVISHDNPDPDSIASAFGLQVLLEEKANIKVDICFSGIIGRVENQVMLRVSPVKVRWLKSRAELGQYDGVIFVDSQPGSGNYSLVFRSTPIAVLDHHPPRPELKLVNYADVRRDLGATTTIVAEYLFASKVKISPWLATCILYGIKSETLDLSRRTTQADIDAYTRLFPLVDFKLLAEIQSPKLPRMYFEHLRRAMERAYIYDGVVISDVGLDARPEVIAEAADLLLRLESVDWSVCYGGFGGELFISVRTSKPGGNAGKLVQQVIDGLGSAGGHDALAGGRIPNAPRSQEDLDKLEAYLTNRFLTELAVKQAPVKKLLEWKPRKSEMPAA